MRRLGAEEKARWGKVVASGRPLHAHTGAPADEPASVSPEPRRAATPKARVIARPEPRTTAPKPGVTLDAGWDRRLGGGLVQPDIVVDLHGHNLANAYHLLDLKLEQAVAMGARVMLPLTGKPSSEEHTSELPVPNAQLVCRLLLE